MKWKRQREEFVRDADRGVHGLGALGEILVHTDRSTTKILWLTVLIAVLTAASLIILVVKRP
jgi:hypothetical protein